MVRLGESACETGWFDRRPDVHDLYFILLICVKGYLYVQYVYGVGLMQCIVPESTAFDNPSGIILIFEPVKDRHNVPLFPSLPSSPLLHYIPSLMALGTQGYPRNPQLLVSPFTQSPPQSSTELSWPDEPVRALSPLTDHFTSCA